MGRSRGGLTTKIHALVDGRGLPVGLHLYEGQASDCREAEPLPEIITEGSTFLADKPVLSLSKGPMTAIPFVQRSKHVAASPASPPSVIVARVSHSANSSIADAEMDLGRKATF